MTTKDIVSYLRSTEKRLMMAVVREKDLFQRELIEEERKAIIKAAELLEKLAATNTEGE